MTSLPTPHWGDCAVGWSTDSNHTGHSCTARHAWFPITYIVLMMIIALVGNTLVLFIYNCRWRSAGTTKVYVSALAILDVFAAVIVMPRDVLTLTFTSTRNLGTHFHADAFCSVVTYAGFVLHFASSFGLVAIAASRYSKASGPLPKMDGSRWKQRNGRRATLVKLLRFLNTHRGAKITSLAFFAISLVLSLPSALLYGNSADRYCIFKQGCDSTCYLACGLKETSDKTLMLTFVVFNFVLFAGVTISLTSLYIAAGCRLRALEENEQRWLAQKPDSVKNTRTVARESEAESTSDETEREMAVNSSCRRREQSSKEVVTETASAAFPLPPLSYRSHEILSPPPTSPDYISNSDDDASNHQTSVLAAARLQMTKSKKKTMTMMIITVIFILSYLPFLSLSIVHRVTPDLCNKISPDWLMFSELLWRSFYVSNAANPIVYGFCNPAFRRVLWKTLRWQTQVI